MKKKKLVIQENTQFTLIPYELNLFLICNPYLFFLFYYSMSAFTRVLRKVALHPSLMLNLSSNVFLQLRLEDIDFQEIKQHITPIRMSTWEWNPNTQLNVTNKPISLFGRKKYWFYYSQFFFVPFQKCHSFKAI